MSNKQRLFEINAKVNKLPLNEDIFRTDRLDDTQEQDELHDEITAQVKSHFDSRMFREGIPQELPMQIMEQNITLQLDEEQPLSLESSNENQIEYQVNYVGTVAQTSFRVYVNVFVDVDPVYTDRKYEFISRILFSPEDVWLDFKD